MSPLRCGCVYDLPSISLVCCFIHSSHVLTVVLFYVMSYISIIFFVNVSTFDFDYIFGGIFPQITFFLSFPMSNFGEVLLVVRGVTHVHEGCPRSPLKPVKVWVFEQENTDTPSGGLFMERYKDNMTDLLVRKKSKQENERCRYDNCFCCWITESPTVVTSKPLTVLFSHP